MRWCLAIFLAAAFAASPLDGLAGEKQIADVKELAGSWRGWVRTEFGRERATMVVEEDGLQSFNHAGHADPGHVLSSRRQAAISIDAHDGHGDPF